MLIPNVNTVVNRARPRTFTDREKSVPGFKACHLFCQGPVELLMLNKKPVLT